MIDRLARATTTGILIGVAAAGCGAGGAAAGAEVVDSAGVAVVTSPGSDLPLELELRDAFALGGEEAGPASFYALHEAGVAGDARGRIYVLDGSSHRVAIFGPDGEAVRTLGREGGGPGELKGGWSLSVTAGGTVSVWDQGKGGLVLWGSDGEPLPEWIPFPRPSYLGGLHHALSGSGYVTSHLGLDAQERRANLLVRVAGEDTATLASQHQPNRESPAMFPSCGGGINFPPLFTPHVVWDHRDGMTAVVPGAGYRIDLYRDGSLVRSVRRDIPVTAATRVVAIAEVGEGFRINFGRGPCLVPPEEYVDARGWASTVPAIANLRIAPDGGLWVQRRVPGEEHPPIDVFGPDGVYAGTLPPGTPFPALLLPDDRVAVITTDDTDVDRLAVKEVVRGEG